MLAEAEQANLYALQKYASMSFLSKALKLCHLNLKHNKTQSILWTEPKSTYGHWST